MMTDIAEQAEALIREAPAGTGLCNWHLRVALLVPELLAELKAERAKVSDRDEALATVREALKATRKVAFGSDDIRQAGWR